eukprot:Amastigsp_a842161_15.p2 type:complete len:344 gc:universal Amastigsp_a842161_15:595-1626(+)
MAARTPVALYALALVAPCALHLCCGAHVRGDEDSALADDSACGRAVVPSELFDPGDSALRSCERLVPALRRRALVIVLGGARSEHRSGACRSELRSRAGSWLGRQQPCAGRQRPCAGLDVGCSDCIWKHAVRNSSAPSFRPRSHQPKPPLRHDLCPYWHCRQHLVVSLHALWLCAHNRVEDVRRLLIAVARIGPVLRCHSCAPAPRNRAVVGDAAGCRRHDPHPRLPVQAPGAQDQKPVVPADAAGPAPQACARARAHAHARHAVVSCRGLRSLCDSSCVHPLPSCCREQRSGNDRRHAVLALLVSAHDGHHHHPGRGAHDPRRPRPGHSALGHSDQDRARAQ